jgi:hypothetical protein
MIDVAALAGTVVGQFLFPYAKAGLKHIAKGVTEGYGKAVGEKLAESSQRVWDTVKGLFSSNDEVITLGLFEKQPDVYREPVKAILTSKLKENEAAARELSNIINAPVNTSGGTVGSIMNATYAAILNLQGAHITGGTFTGMSFGSAEPSAAPVPPETPPAKKE